MNSTTKIIAGVAVFALLFAGIGFALQYNATTSSTGNTVGVAYLTLNDGVEADDAKLIGDNSKIMFNTVTEDGTVAYTLAEGSGIVAGEITIFNMNHNGTENQQVTATLSITPTTTFPSANLVAKYALNPGETPSYTEFDLEGNVWSADLTLLAGANVVKVQFELTGIGTLTPEQAQALAGTWTFDIEASVA